MTRMLKEDGKLNLLKGLITVEGSCSLTAGITAAEFDNIPYLAFKGDYSVRGAKLRLMPSTRDGPRVKADYITLDSPSYNGKFNGAPHMMMDGTDNPPMTHMR
jgi:hypothetical protein